MPLDADAGSKFDLDLLMMKLGPSEIFDPKAKEGLRPLQWKVHGELKSAAKITTKIRRLCLKRLMLEDFHRESAELRLFGKCFGDAQDAYK